ncbi:MAG: protein phosphatase 2C domain-containing protein [Oscillospiraceae bacterium]|jgi:protein phosphatase|nr:protein phosphatase 2C domain-containing protein [Oscillospiraceae bacterium]
MRAVYRTHPGFVREKNEDTVLVDPSGLYIIADGMGGHLAGEIASSMAADSLKRSLTGVPFGAGALREAIAAANKTIFDKSQTRADFQGMGTTVTLLWIAPGGAREHGVMIAQLGDSRAYLLRGKCLHRCTRDHSRVDDLLRTKAITPEQARVHPERSVITRALGIKKTASPDLFGWDRQPGDLWLLCSDGLTNMIDDASIASILRGYTIDEAADILMREALNCGGIDNISLVLVYDGEPGDSGYPIAGKEADL